MEESRIGLIRNVLISPWYGEFYDLFVTDHRFVFVFAQKLTMRTKKAFTEPAQPILEYERESMDSLASRKKSLSIPYSSLVTVSLVSGHGTMGSLWSLMVYHDLIMRYSLSEKKERQITVRIIAPIKMSMAYPAVIDPKSNQSGGQKAYAESVRQMLEKILPRNVIDDDHWTA